MAQFDPKDGNVQGIYVARARNPTPYAVGIDADGYIWYNSHLMDVLGTPRSQDRKVIEYPFPHPELSMREFFLDAQGRMWYGTQSK